MSNKNSHDLCGVITTTILPMPNYKHNKTMIPSLRPISFEENKEAGDFHGRALFTVVDPDTNEASILFVRNLVEKEKDPNSSNFLRQVIEDVWTTLSTDDGIITPDLLRHVLGGMSFGDILIDEVVNKNPTPSKQIQSVRSLSTQSAIKSANTHPLSMFFCSKFGVMVLRHVLDLKAQSMKQMKKPSVGYMSIRSMNKRFIESPSNCLYVRSLKSGSRNKQKSVGAYVRLQPTYTYGMSPLLKDACVSLPSDDAFQALNVTNPDHTYIYGQIRSGYMSNLGNLFTSNEEYEERKNTIKASITARENHARMNKTTYKPSQMYDSYAGQRDLDKALYEMTLFDAPPHSILSTVCAMKRNIIILIYMGLSHLDCLSSRQGFQSGDVKEICEELGEAFLTYFRPSQGKGKNLNQVRCPIKVASASKRPYIRLDEKVMRRIDPDMRNKRWAEKLDMLGTTKDRVSILEQMSDHTYQHLPIRNVLSGNELMDVEKHSITDSFDEGDSLVAVPMVLGSYWEKQDMSGAPPKVLGRMWTHSNPYQISVLPTLVCKASCIYGRKAGVDVESQDTDRKDCEEIYEHAKGLLDCGMTRDETFQTLSLSEAQKMVVSEMLDQTNEEPPSKKIKV